MCSVRRMRPVDSGHEMHPMGLLQPASRGPATFKVGKSVSAPTPTNERILILPFPRRIRSSEQGEYSASRHQTTLRFLPQVLPTRARRRKSNQFSTSSHPANGAFQKECPKEERARLGHVIYRCEKFCYLSVAMWSGISD